MKQLCPSILFGISLVAAARLPAADIDETGSLKVVRDAGRLKQGTFFYHDLDHGKEVGTSSIAIQRIPGSGNYVFANEATFAGDFSGFHSQRWRAIAGADFAPVSAVLEFVSESETSPIFELHYAAGRVSGFAVERKPPAPPARRLIDAAIRGNTVDQRIDWAAAIAGPLQAGRESEFSVYDPGTGVSRVIERVSGPEPIKTPAGTFSVIRITYEVEKLGKVERYIVFATREAPRIMIREDFPNGVVTELVRTSPKPSRQPKLP